MLLLLLFFLSSLLVFSSRYLDSCHLVSLLPNLPPGGSTCCKAETIAVFGEPNSICFHLQLMFHLISVDWSAPWGNRLKIKAQTHGIKPTLAVPLLATCQFISQTVPRSGSPCHNLCYMWCLSTFIFTFSSLTCWFIPRVSLWDSWPENGQFFPNHPARCLNWRRS